LTDILILKTNKKYFNKIEKLTYKSGYYFFKSWILFFNSSYIHKFPQEKRNNFCEK